MKIFKNITIFLLNILMICACIVATASACWYFVPGIQLTELGLFIAKHISKTAIMVSGILSACYIAVAVLLLILISKSKSAKYKNFFIHLNTWIISILLIGAAIYTFIFVDPLITESVTISIPDKILIGSLISFLVVFHLFSRKISTIINRKIQAYDTAKEMNTVGRSSIILTNFLKLFEIFFPEMIVLGLLCICVSWNLSSYFILTLVASIVPVLGNIISDFNTRKAIIKDKKEKDAEFAKQVADNVRRG